MAVSLSPATLEEIKARTDLADLISSYGIQLKRAGGRFMACCPFHHEKTPSFNIQPEKGFYYCFGCGEKGDAFSFVQRQEGLTFIEAARKLAAACGVKLEERADPDAARRARQLALHAELAAFFQRCLRQTREAQEARAYLASRALPDDVVEAFGIGYAPVGIVPMQKWAEKNGFQLEELAEAGVLLPPTERIPRWYNRFGGRLMFTIRDRAGRPVAFSGRVLEAAAKAAKYVNSPETLIFKKSSVLFGLDQAQSFILSADRRQALVCEGQIDVIRCHACGFRTAVASQGTSFTKEHVQLLKKYADSVVLVFDGDGAGQKAAIRTGSAFLEEGIPVRVATLPAGEDPDSLLRTKGPDAFRTCLTEAESITRFQIRTLCAAEQNPSSIDAVARVSREVLKTLTLCPVAVMRASLLEEAAGLLHIPVSALEEDFARAREQARHTPAHRPAEPLPEPVSPSEETEPAPEGPAVSGPAAYDAAASDNNPPSPREREFCEFLYEHEHDTALLPLVERYACEDVLDHSFTRRFVAAWKAGCAGGADVADALTELSAAERGWLNAILLAEGRSGFSELPAERILETYLRQFWMAAFRRCQGALPIVSTPENDAKRLHLSACIRRIQREPWEKAVAWMDETRLVT